MAWNKLVPYDELGNMMSYDMGVHEWRPAAEFTACLTYEGYYRGRSAAVFVFRDPSGHKYPMFISSFDEVVRLMANGTVTGKFIPVKRGANYGIEFVK